MLIFKIVATLLLLWLVAGIIGLIFNSRVSRNFPTTVTICCAVALTYFLWLA